MGNPKQKWTTEEEEALKAGVAKHGAGKWKNIQRDPEFHPHLFSRSNIDLKDKWRNMTVNAGEKSRPSKPKASTPTASGVLAIEAAPAALAIEAAPAPAPGSVVSSSAVPVRVSPASASAPAPASGDAKVEDSKSVAVETITFPRYNGVIFEAISALNESKGHGAGVQEIINYIQQRHQIPPNFRKQLVTKLRKLVNQQKLEKIVNVYKIMKKEPSIETKTPAPEENYMKPRYIQNAAPKKPSNHPLQDASDAATLRIAEAENKSFVAAEAITEAERISKMAEEAESVLQLAQEILEKCLREEEVVLRV